MGTGVTFLPSSPHNFNQENIILSKLDKLKIVFFSLTVYHRLNLWLSPRPISICQLHTLLHFHLKPINLVVYKGSYILGNLILRGASRLDAFSVYPVRPWLPGDAPSGTTGTPEGRSS